MSGFCEMSFNFYTATLSVAKDGVWIELTYTNGDKYHNHCNKNQRIARIAFLCDPLVHGKVSVCSGPSTTVINYYFTGQFGLFRGEQSG